MTIPAQGDDSAGCSRSERPGTTFPPVAYYVTAHGYGHGVRSCDIIRSLNELRPDLRVTIVSDLPESFFRNRLSRESNSYRTGAFDAGMVQLDSIRVDVDATREKVERLYSLRADLVAQEAEFLEQGGFGLLVADIPAIPLEAAALAGIPRIAVGNFSWDWIYSEFASRDARWQAAIQALEQGYAQANLLLRLPFSGDMRIFRRAEDLPLLASPGRSCRQEIANLTGCPFETKWILLSFTTLDWGAEALDRVESLTEYSFITVLPLAWKRNNLFAVDREKVAFPDIVASVDAVLSKPGFGIVSDCIANQKPLIYADRSNFLEYEFLVSGIRRFLKHVHISAERLYGGDLSAALKAVEYAASPPEVIARGGAEVAARRMLEFLVCE